MHEVGERTAELAQLLVDTARERGATVATAESCTAGLVSAAIAGVPGASEVLAGGAVTYTERIKHRVLGVSETTLARCTAVSEACAREMAEGARELFACDCAVSVTGYAGPGGGTEQEPVGTVYLGVASAVGTHVERRRFEGDRSAVRAQACCEALRLLCEALVEARASR